MGLLNTVSLILLRPVGVEVVLSVYIVGSACRRDRRVAVWLGICGGCVRTWAVYTMSVACQNEASLGCHACHSWFLQMILYIYRKVKAH